MKLRDFIVDSQLGNMGAKSFRTWHVVASLLDGDGNKLRGEARDIAQEITQRTRFPVQPFPDLFLIVGRRAGKTQFVANVNAYTCAQDYHARMAPGETAVAAAVAPTTDQASILFDYTRAVITESPLLRQQVLRETATEIELAHGTTFKVYAGSMRSTRGPTFARVSIDEASFLRDEASANPDVELVRAVRPGCVTLGGSLICFSSPYMRRGVMFSAHRAHFGNNDSRVLVVAGESRLFNPTLDAERIALAYEEDPESAAAEWGGRFRSDLTAPFAELVDAAIDSGVHQRPVMIEPGKPRAWEYKSFTDPSGGQGRDSWSTRVVHVEGEVVFDDAVLEIRPPFNTDQAAKQVADFLKSYGIAHTQGDRYAGAWPADALRRYGVAYSVCEQDKSTIYKETLPLFSAHRVRLLDHARTATQLRAIERRTRAGGKDSYDHPPGGNDDNANALCGALVLAGGRRSAGADTTHVERSTVLDAISGRSVVSGEPFVSIFEEAERRALDRWRDL